MGGGGHWLLSLVYKFIRRFLQKEAVDSGKHGIKKVALPLVLLSLHSFIRVNAFRCQTFRLSVSTTHTCIMNACMYTHVCHRGQSQAFHLVWDKLSLFLVQHVVDQPC